MSFKVEYEVSLPLNGKLSIEVDSNEFEDMNEGEIEYEIGLIIQDHFEQNVNWYSENRSEIVKEIMKQKET